MHDEAYQQAISVESALKRPATLWLSMLSPVCSAVRIPASFYNLSHRCLRGIGDQGRDGVGFEAEISAQARVVIWWPKTSGQSLQKQGMNISGQRLRNGVGEGVKSSLGEGQVVATDDAYVLAYASRSSPALKYVQSG